MSVKSVFHKCPCCKGTNIDLYKFRGRRPIDILCCNQPFCDLAAYGPVTVQHWTQIQNNQVAFPNPKQAIVPLDRRHRGPDQRTIKSFLANLLSKRIIVVIVVATISWILFI